MSDEINPSPQILNQFAAAQQATLNGTTRPHGQAGQAYHSVAQSTAIAVQDATDQLRNLSTIGTTAIGMAMAQMLATGDVERYSPIIKEAQHMMTTEAKNFETIGTSAASVLKSFTG